MVDYSHRLTVAKNHLETTDDILKANSQYILDFVEFISSEGISKPRQVKYIYNLKTVARLLDKDFNKSTKQDMIKLGSKINDSDYTAWTKHDFIVETKRFFRWLKYEYLWTSDEEPPDGYPPEIKHLKTNMKRSRKKLPKQLLTIEDVKKLADHTNNLRDRCLILLLYESGSRIGELLNIKIKDIDNDKYGSKIDLFGKTGARKIRVIAASPSISNWLQEHPNRTMNKKDFNNSYLFCGLWGPNKGNQLMYRHVNKLLKEAGKKADINKPLHPHHFRHSRATELANKFIESQLCEYLGWVQGSKEAATYVHLSGRDTDKAVLQLYGIKQDERFCLKCKKQIDEKYDNEKHEGVCPLCGKQTSFVLESQLNQFKPVKCPRCNTVNDPSAKFCSQCSLGLDEKSVMEYDTQKEIATETGFATQEMLKDKKFRDFYNEMLAKTWEQYKKMKK